MIKLAVNIDHVATIREARKTDEPDPVFAAMIIEQTGAHGIVMHLRQDRRHVQDRDLKLIKNLAKLPINLEMAASDRMLDIVKEVIPHTVTLVPEEPNEITTQGGLNVLGNQNNLQNFLKGLKPYTSEISLFIDSEIEQIKAAYDIGADGIELNTGPYSESHTRNEINTEIQRLSIAAKNAHEKGLKIRAGHGLTYLNVSRLVNLPYLFELSIGHSIISRAVFTGLKSAIEDMLKLISA